MGKGVIFTMRGCLRSITNYPFLVFLLCVLIFMYISSPFMFSMVVSASPILVCTAVLLGTVLFYGKPKVDEKTTPIKSDLLKDGDVGEVGLSKVEETESEKENGEVLEGNRGLDDGIEKQKDEWSYERFAKVNGVESEYEKSEAESCDDDGGLDSGSNESMADMMPMLDELHPLLQMSRVCSEAPSEQSPRTSISSAEDNTNQNEGNEGGDEEKAAIIWTEEDQKNVMELGSSEIERNKRLENLLTRRMRRNTSMLPEINLIDLESSDFPYHIPHISTTRQNPFDLPHAPYFDLGLPPIPSSAPPVLLPRMNPFDIPYEASEANPYNRFHEELKTSESREAFFRRHENSSVGPSVFAPKNQHLKWGSFFVPEQIALELGSVEKTHKQDSVEPDKSFTNESPDDIPNYDPVYDSSPNAVKTPNSEDDFVEANETLISTPSAGGIKPHFHDRLLHQHLEEMADTLKTHEETDEIDVHLESSKDQKELKLPPKGSSSKCLSSTRASSPTKSQENTKAISVNRRFSTPF